MRSFLICACVMTRNCEEALYEEEEGETEFDSDDKDEEEEWTVIQIDV